MVAKRYGCLNQKRMDGSNRDLVRLFKRISRIVLTSGMPEIINLFINNLGRNT